MAYLFRGAARAATLALVLSTTAAYAGNTASADTVWQLRSGLNVAALACRGVDEAVIVAGYNRLLADRRGELADVYRTVSHDYGSAAAFDAAMTRLYNNFAQPAAQATLCDNARDVLAMMAAQGDRPLTATADDALAMLEGRDTMAMTQVAVASIPQIVPPPADVEDGIPDGD